ncbi:protein phosphatase 2C domain-containing protein [Glycomyces tritici]|uniref:Protein phosphatase 2C domain-containing protein n=1 Tax=Glycomyces tritici TaxID=2665176 RepID=A0ABT7YM80_9ACTN|nr:protein phosphatase 2C domain-containing protein [Glycomyces tritici]MDN3239729.1 protein phosphatase 2C domain-containing protein [Glycomyces tritici]
MRISAVSLPGGSAPNEDAYLVADRWALVLDGITRYPDDGCVHDVPWYVARLGREIKHRIGSMQAGLPAILDDSIRGVSGEHHATCDLSNPVTPGSTVGLIRREADRISWLLLGDCTLAWRDRDGRVECRSDDRLARLAGAPVASVGGVRRWPVAYVATVRNRDGGYWVADADSRAAAQALTGSIELDGLSELLLCTDGITRLVDRYGYDWPELFERVAVDGVEGLAGLVREHERGDARFHPESKRHDDATAVHVRFQSASGPSL